MLLCSVPGSDMIPRIKLNLDDATCKSDSSQVGKDGEEPKEKKRKEEETVTNDEEEKSDEAHANLVKLTEIAYRIRMGHRGAL